MSKQLEYLESPEMEAQEHPERPAQSTPHQTTTCKTLVQHKHQVIPNVTYCTTQAEALAATVDHQSLARVAMSPHLRQGLLGLEELHC